MALVGGTIFKELFSSNSVNSLYDRAVKQCLEDERVQNHLGEPIKAFGEERGGRRGRNRVAQLAYTDSAGRAGVRLQFYLQGVRNRATVELDSRADSSGSFHTRYLIVRVEDLLRNTVLLEDNRAAME